MFDSLCVLRLPAGRLVGQATGEAGLCDRVRRRRLSVGPQDLWQVGARERINYSRPEKGFNLFHIPMMPLFLLAEKLLILSACCIQLGRWADSCEQKSLGQ